MPLTHFASVIPYSGLFFIPIIKLQSVFPQDITFLLTETHLFVCKTCFQTNIWKIKRAWFLLFVCVLNVLEEKAKLQCITIVII